MANSIYRHLLSSSNIAARDIWNLEETINSWHDNSSFCTRQTSTSTAPDWYITSCDRQILCDRSLRLLVHRPLLFQWLARRRVMQGKPAEDEQCEEFNGLLQGLRIARTTIEFISNILENGRYSRLILSFLLYGHPITTSIHIRKSDLDLFI